MMRTSNHHSCLGIPASFSIFVTESYFLAAKHPVTPLRAVAAAGGINLVGDLLLVNVLGWGIAGAALATAAAQARAANRHMRNTRQGD